VGVVRDCSKVVVYASGIGWTQKFNDPVVTRVGRMVLPRCHHCASQFLSVIPFDFTYMFRPYTFLVTQV
jgi:hypothetical protein